MCHEGSRLRRIFGTRRDGAIGNWRKLHNEELHNFYSSPHIIRVIKSSRIRWAGGVAYMVAKRNPYRILVGKPKGERLLGRPRHRRDGNIKVVLREIGSYGLD
jgi:hypothetical protein